MLNIDLSADGKFDTEISELFSKICYNNCENFNELIMKCSDENKKNINWWVSNPASRNTLNSNLYLDFCKVQLVNYLLSVGESINKINVDSKAMRNVLKQISVLDKTNILLKRKKIKSALKDILVILILPLRKCIICSFHLLIFKIFFKHKIKLPKHPITLIDTYALPGYYSKDRYYNGLWTALNATEKKGIYFVPTIVMTKWNKMFSAYKELINADRQFIFKEKYLKLSDIIYAVLYPIRVHFFKTKSTLVNNIDYSSLISGDLRKRGSYSLAIEGLINYRFIKRLKKKKIKINRFIDWWESQALDKGLHKAINDYYPNVPVIGYLGYAPREMELQLYPTKFELENGVVPKLIAVMGKGFIDSMKIFNSNQKVTYAPAFRFQHLWNGKPRLTDKAFYTILIALPITIDDSVQIIEQMIACIEDKSLKTMRFWIKPHPTMPAERLKRKFGSRWPQSFHFTDLDTQAALRKSDILVSGMSSICLEAMALGIPVLVVDQPHGLQYNPIPYELDQDLWKKCSFNEDILNGIILFRERDEKELARHHLLGLQIRETYFEPVTREGVLKFLDIERNSTIGES